MSAAVSVVVCTYAAPRALEACLRSLGGQRGTPFEVVVAEDGRDPETAAVVERWRHRLAGPVHHVSQDDSGWRVARARNLGALAASGDVLVFLDGDCLARPRLLESVRDHSRPDRFLASKRLHLDPRLTARVLAGRDCSGWSAARFLLTRPWSFRRQARETNSVGVLLPVRARRPRARADRFVPPFDAYGFFMAIPRGAFQSVNGFDLEFAGWGGEDVDLARRLERLGLRCAWAGPRSTLLHLWHTPQKGLHPSNHPRVSASDRSARVEAAYGLRQLELELAAAGAGT